ncbi:DUF2721 domain-containing protein [Candidatus Marinamargulisbacteria bacterium SCGC AG-343-K17]|nr:DUF2721 domain-containing protein [Candidatus Marinamargulisbacteria bacterium SCGC AG-343-K17]
MQINITTPAILFPAITLLMLAYTNRFLALSQLIRSLHKEYKENQSLNILKQIQHLKYRILLIRFMQAFGALSILVCALSISFIFFGVDQIGAVLFFCSVILFILSVISSFIEIVLSTKALAVLLSDIENKV